MNFVFDIDGTICFKDNIIESDIVNSLKFLESLGHNVIFSSARSYRDCLPVIKDFKKNLVVGLNGGVCYKDNDLIFKRTISDNTLKNILAIINDYDLAYF